MARMKVFRTPIGFHDAYVAATSRKAALEAWGSDRDLFARGVAEEVTDPALTEAPLARPGEVVKRSRGTVAEQLAAPPAAERKAAAPEAKAAPDRAAPVRVPKPDRDALDAAEAALARAEAQEAATAKDFDAREAALARERRAAEREARDTIARATRTRDREARDHARAMAAWRDGTA